MLCCVSKKSVSAPKVNKTLSSALVPLKEKSSNFPAFAGFLSTTNKLHNLKTEKLEKVEKNCNKSGEDGNCSEKDDSSILLPCAICGRTFKPQSLEKHFIICERTAQRKRKPFDSAKQRIQGTELEEFLPKEKKRKIFQEERKISWKQHHDEFIKTIRAARGSVGELPVCRQAGAIVAQGAPTRANEQGLCPTCYRHFGIKAYDRHVAWCKERIARAPASPATNIAKERLDARMKYRAPLIKNRRMTNKEKYAPNSGNKNINNNHNNHNNNNHHNVSNSSASSLATRKESMSSNCNKINETLSIRPPATTERRKSNGQSKIDSPITPGPVKSRLADRTKNSDSYNFMALTSIVPSINPPDDHIYNSPSNSCHNLSQNNEFGMTRMINSIKKKPRVQTKNYKNSKLYTKIRKQFFLPDINLKVNDVKNNNDVMPINGIGKPFDDSYNKHESMVTWKRISDDNAKLKLNHETFQRECFDTNKETESINKLNQTYSIKDSNENELSGFELIEKRPESSTPVNENRILSDDSLKNQQKSPRSGRFKRSFSCKNASEAFKDRRKKNCYTADEEEHGGEQIEAKVEVIDDVDDDLERDSIFSQKKQTISDAAIKRSSTPKKDFDISAISEQGITSINKQCDKETFNFETDIKKSDEKIVIIDEIIPISSLNAKKSKFHLNLPSKTLTTDSLDSARSSEIIAIRKKLRKKMHLLRESTDSLVSSVDIETNDVALPKMRMAMKEDNKLRDRNLNGMKAGSVRKLVFNPETEIPQDGKYEKRPKSIQDRDVACWKRMIRSSRSKLFYQLMRNPKPHFLPPIVSNERSGISQDYDPFALTDRQLTDLLSDTCSDRSFPDSPANRYKPNSSPHYPLTHSSAFVKYPNTPHNLNTPEKRDSLIAPPSEFDDMSIGCSSDSTETNSISRELFPELESHTRSEQNKNNNDNNNKTSQQILGRRVIIDKSKALGANIESLDDNLNRKNSNSNVAIQKSRQIVEKVTTKCIRPQVTRSNSVRAVSAPKLPDNRSTLLTNKMNCRSTATTPGSRPYQSKNINYANFDGSNLSLSSIVSSEVDVKRSNSAYEDLVSSFDDDSSSFPSLKSFLKDDSLSISSPVQASRLRNNQISDEDLSSPDSYKRPDNKLSADSAYSSLNRKYSNHGCNGTIDTTGRVNEDPSKRRRDSEGTSTANKSKMSKFCYECGTRFPETAKFCCECGIQRLAL